MKSSDKFSLSSEESNQFQLYQCDLKKIQISSQEIGINNCQQFQSSRRARKLKTFESLKIDVSIKKESITQDNIPLTRAEEQLFTTYTKVKQIGMGFQSICYKVQHNRTKVFYVAKIARCTLNDQEFLLSLKQEYKLLQQLDHPDIIRIYESFESENEFIQITEFVNAQSLETKIFTRQFQEQEIVQIGYKLLKTLEYLHQQGIIHRDINLSNVLYSRKRNIFKLLDFGVAKCQLNQTIFNLSSSGKKKFQAPEMLSCKLYSFKIDVWGVGLILYSLVHSNSIGTKSLLKKQYKLSFLNNSEQFQELQTKLLEIDQDKRVTAKEALELNIFKEFF